MRITIQTCHHCRKKFDYMWSRGHWWSEKLEKISQHKDSDFCPECTGKYKLPFYILLKRRFKNWWWLHFTKFGRVWRKTVKEFRPIKPYIYNNKIDGVQPLSQPSNICFYLKYGDLRDRKITTKIIP